MDRNNEPRDGQVIDFSAIRDAKIEEKRRKYERVLFKNILGVYCVAEGEGLKAVELIDISPEGLSFQLPVGSPNTKSIQVGTEMTIRFYFSQDTFIPVSLKVNNSRPCIEEGLLTLAMDAPYLKTLKATRLIKLLRSSWHFMPRLHIMIEEISSFFIFSYNYQ